MLGHPKQPIFPLLAGLALGLLGFALDLWGFVLGLGAFSDTNMLVSPTQNNCTGGLDQRESPTQRDSRCSGITFTKC